MVKFKFYYSVYKKTYADSLNPFEERIIEMDGSNVSDDIELACLLLRESEPNQILIIMKIERL